MTLRVREMHLDDIEKVVDYFIYANDTFLKGMGADKNKLPKRAAWIQKITLELEKPYPKKKFYYMIWLLDNQPIGHSNVNHIKYGEEAKMHLHLWKPIKRKKGLGVKLLKLTIPYFFKNLQLEKLICEPYAENIAPNKTLKKLGFELVKTYKTTPGWINFYQTVHRYELTHKQLEAIHNS